MSRIRGRDTMQEKIVLNYFLSRIYAIILNAMYYLNKFVGWVLSPLGVAFVGLGIGFLLRRAFARRLAWLGSVVSVVSIAFLWVMSLGVTTRFVGLGLEREWERDGTVHGAIDGIPDADAIIILGGGVGSHEKCHAPELFSGADRVWHGARVYNVKKAAMPWLKVFCTGGGCEYAAVPLLVDLGVPREAISFFEEPRNTEEEALLIRRELGGEDPRVILVTSAWHMSRAKMLFERCGFEVLPAPTDFEMNCSAEKELELADFFPSAEALLRNSYAVKEWVAMLGYSVLGGRKGGGRSDVAPTVNN